jgi:hydroxymethylpyrimidine pyrophosphatase-like HAD family hydrolase
MDQFMNIKIAVDFDGTIVDHEYPKIGKEKLFAFRTLKELEKQGARIILWTFRAGKELDEAVEYCRQNGIEFYAVNKNYPEEILDENISRKIDADIFPAGARYGSSFSPTTFRKRWLKRDYQVRLAI